MTYETQHISITINRSHNDVYSFASNPENMPKWASGLSGSIEEVGDHWESMSPMGKVKVTFAPTNSFGIIDHEVTLPNGDKVYNPLRVIKNHDGADVVFTLHRRPEMSVDDFAKDAEHVIEDLKSLKKILDLP